MKESIIIIGANGQIGTELAIALRKKFGAENVVTTDIREPQTKSSDENFEIANVLDKNGLDTLFQKYKPTQIYLLAAMLSATGEKYPEKAWELNMNGLLNVLDLAVTYNVSRIFWPSSIAVFGPHSPKINTEQYCVMDPNTIYGISKLAGERLIEWYQEHRGLDIRSVRYPGIISWKTEPGGGTTDYAVDIFYEALKTGNYTCFLSEDTALPMLYMDDAINATLKLMEAPKDSLTVRSSYNLGGMSFTPKELSEEIKKEIPEFTIDYKPDFRQQIADSWPASIDDSVAKKDWGLTYDFGISEMTKDMIKNLRVKLNKN